MTQPIAPSQTLYIKNLDDKLSKSEIKRELYCLFSFVAPVVEIVAKGGASTRGQAWISFASVEEAGIAMQRLQNFDFFGKALNISYARSRSKVIAEYFSSNSAQKKTSEVAAAVTEVIKSRAVLVNGLPPRINPKIVDMLFRQFTGFEKSENKDGKTIVYYQQPEQAEEAISKLQNYTISETHKFQLSFFNEG